MSNKSKVVKKGEVVRDALVKLADSRGALSPRAVLDTARDPRSVLHNYFQWDDAKAGEAFRLIQASALIRSVKLEVIVDSQEPMRVNIVMQRAFPSLPSLRGSSGGSYLPIEKIEDKTELLNEVVGQLEQLRRKHATLTQLQGVWKAVDEVHI